MENEGIYVDENMSIHTHTNTHTHGEHNCEKLLESEKKSRGEIYLAQAVSI